MVKNPLANAGDGLDPWSRRFPHATGQLSAYTTAAELEHPRARALQQEKPLQ